MASDEATATVLSVDGQRVECPSEGTLLDVLKDHCGLVTVKDGCSPQGQCGCCTVLVDGAPRVSCVTPARRMAGRSITTLDGVDAALKARLMAAFDTTAASQCGFCTPGILMRLAGLARKGVPTETQVRTALGAHLCRCTGFQPIVDAALVALDPSADLGEPRDLVLAAQRATLESGTAQHVGEDVMEGAPGFAIDSAPVGCIVALATQDGGYQLNDAGPDATSEAKKVQGRNSTVPLRAPVSLPEIDYAALVLQTTFVEPAYLEPDSSWCSPGGDPASPYANGGAFGAKRNSPITSDAKRLAQEQQRPVLATWPREEVVRRGAKRPPLAIALRSDGSGVVRIGRTPRSDGFEGLLASLAGSFPDISFEVAEVLGPRIGVTHRGAVVAELLAARAALSAVSNGPVTVEAPNGARTDVSIDQDGSVAVEVCAGRALCKATLSSYVVGAVHQGLGMVRTEGIAVDEAGLVHDLTIRSFGIITAAQMPRVTVVIREDDREPCASGVAVMAATMAAAWVGSGLGSMWPVEREVFS